MGRLEEHEDVQTQLFPTDVAQCPTAGRKANALAGLFFEQFIR